MEQINIVYGLGIVAFVLIYTAMSLARLKKEEDGKHPALTLLFLAIGLLLLAQIPATYLKFDQSCYPVVANSTSDGTTTAYEYSQYCTTQTTHTSLTFYKFLLYVNYLFFVYIAGWYFYQYILAPMIKKRKERFGKNG